LYSEYSRKENDAQFLVSTSLAAEIHLWNACLPRGITALLSIAYVYMPPEDRTETPAYLTYLQGHHLDGYVDAGNFRLHYLHEGTGEPVVLLPGNGVWIYSFRTIIPTLAQQYSVYATERKTS